MKTNDIEARWGKWMFIWKERGEYVKEIIVDDVILLFLQWSPMGKIKSMSSDEVWLLYLDNIGAGDFHSLKHTIKSLTIVEHLIIRWVCVCSLEAWTFDEWNEKRNQTVRNQLNGTMNGSAVAESERKRRIVETGREKQRFDCVLENYYDLAIVTKSKLIENTSAAAAVTAADRRHHCRRSRSHSILITTCTFNQTINYDRIN